MDGCNHARRDDARGRCIVELAADRASVMALWYLHVAAFTVMAPATTPR